ncbi:MAG: hypothetical protein KDA84_06475, partial [Planctomycetaceae bacterium]|nr:hypothetical protein [Planctomycetaceae bacterium]
SDSLQQFTGVSNAADAGNRATTEILGKVNVMNFDGNLDGIRIATQDVTYNSDMVTNGQQALTEADGSIFYLGGSSLTTAGGMVVSRAITTGDDTMGEITMAEAVGSTATIDAGGGMVVFEAGSNIRVSQIRTTDGFVTLTSRNGRVIDQGDTDTQDIVAKELRIDAELGIGVDGPGGTLETSISNLEAMNEMNGISLINMGDLTIGGIQSTSAATLRRELNSDTDNSTLISLPTLNGVVTTTGDITITTTGSMTVNEDILNKGEEAPDNISLTAQTGSFTVNQTTEPADTNMPNVTNIQANNGSVTINAGQDVTMNGATRTSAENGNASITAANNFTANTATTIVTSNGSVGITATSGNATFNGSTDIDGNSGSVNVMAGGNITMNDTTNIATNDPANASDMLGNTEFTAGNNIVANNTTTITATNGNATFTAGNDLTANNSTTIMTTNGNAMFTSGNNFNSNNSTKVSSSNGSIFINVGDNDIQTNAAGLFEVTINNPNADFTATDNSNFTAVGGNLMIFVGNDFSTGIKGTAGKTIMTSSVDDVYVQTGGTAMFGGHVGASGGGDVLVNSKGDFTLQKNTLPGMNEIVVGAGGQVVVVSQGKIQYNELSDATVQSATGSIRTVDRMAVPLIRNISPRQVNVIGEAVFTFDLGLPGETNFTVFVDWGDSTVESFVFQEAGPQLLRHTYKKPPNPSNPGAAIKFLVVAITDPNIHFFGNNNFVNFGISSDDNPLRVGPDLAQRSGPIDIGSFLEPQVDFPLFLSDLSNSRNDPNSTLNSEFLGFIQQALDPTNPFTMANFAEAIDNLTVASDFSEFPVPVSGFGAFAIDLPEELPPFFIPGASVTPLPENISDGGEEPDDLDSASSEPEEKTEEEIVVKLRVLSPSGQMLYEFNIPQIYLSDPTLLWAKLPDGRYQIVIEEKGGAAPVIVRDVELKEHEVIRRFDGRRREESGDTTRVEPN